MAKMNVNPNNRIISYLMGIVQHYNPNKYWKYREIVVNPNSRVPKFVKLYMLFYIKRCDAYNNASLGTDINQGAIFKSRPLFPHGLNGCIIHLKAQIGKNALIYHQVTIASAKGGTPKIGDNCLIGAGAKIIGGVTIGNNVRIGANAVVTKDIPDNATVVCAPNRIIIREK
jgi:serine acetyltransferase